ncbi:hypothetical protein GYB22_02170 [bacterium]|nr:hypothetical protein [bacterium]
MKTLKQKLLLLTLSIACAFPASAQLTVGYNIRPLFNNFQGMPTNVIVKYSFMDQQFAGRLRGGYSQFKFQNNQNFFEDDQYTNLDAWPEDVSMKANVNNNKAYSIAPGFEYRFVRKEKTTIYAGLELMITKNISDQSWTWHGNSINQQDPMFTISQIRTNEFSGVTTEISPFLLMGFQYNISPAWSVFTEASIGSSSTRSDGEQRNRMFFWDYVDEEFEEQENNQPQLKDQEQPWNHMINFNPSLNFFVAYTFGTDK